MSLRLCLLFALACVIEPAMRGQIIKQPTLAETTRWLSLTHAEAPLPDPSPSSPVVLNTTIAVHDILTAADRGSAPPHHASAEEILSSAGTYGDLSRYMQLFPGVIFNTDQSNDILVRGGNPLENLYLVDGIEIPNINHLAADASTGGLVSMIDTASIEGIDLYTDDYDASYEDRLSSVIEIHTREPQQQWHTEGDVGFVGAGLITASPLRHGNSLLLSAHRSLLNLFTDDIGLNGVPTYTNGLLSARIQQNDASELHLLSLGGTDSIRITPGATDPWETNTVQTQYSGWRFTNGVRWRLQPNAENSSIFTISDSEQHQDIAQQDQYFKQVAQFHSEVPTPVYAENSNEGTTTLKYDGIFPLPRQWTLLTGGGLHLYRVDYNVAQPVGEKSPLSTDPIRSDATSFRSHFLTEESFFYGQAIWRPSNRWSLSTGGRLESFSFENASSLTPRVHALFRVSEHQSLHASFAEYAQLPPFAYLVSYPQNAALRMIHARHWSAGAILYSSSRGELGLELYRKHYRNYPVSTEYPSLSLANMVDTLGQQILWIPLTSRGSGISEGIELSGRWHPVNSLSLLGNFSYARARFAALDGVLRPGNFDYPVVLNLAGSYRPDLRYELTWRYEYMTGKPYTPFLLSASVAQNRPVFDLSQVNADRAPYYERLDFQLNRTFHMGPHRFILYAGLENAFNRENFLGYFWMPRYGYTGKCAAAPERCVSEQNQMGRFPNFGARYIF